MVVSVCRRGWPAASWEELVVFLQLGMRTQYANLKTGPSQAPRG